MNKSKNIQEVRLERSMVPMQINQSLYMVPGGVGYERNIIDIYSLLAGLMGNYHK